MAADNPNGKRHNYRPFDRTMPEPVEDLIQAYRRLLNGEFVK